MNGRPATTVTGRPASRPASRLAAPLLVAAAAVAATATVGVVDPATPGHYPGCPILAVTGLACPGCGGLRAVHALTRGDVAAALDLNALVVVAIPIAVAAYLAWFRARLRGPVPSAASAAAAVAAPVAAAPSGTTRAAAGWVVALVACLGFAIARNLPAFAVLAP